MTDALADPANVLSKLEELASQRKWLEEHRPAVEEYARRQEQYVLGLAKAKEALKDFPALYSQFEQQAIASPVTPIEDLEEIVAPSGKPARAAGPAISVVRKNITALPKDRAATTNELAKIYETSRDKVGKALNDEGWQNIFNVYYVHTDTFGKDVAKGVIGKAFEGGRNLKGAQEYLKGIGIAVYDFQVAELASQFGLLDLEKTAEEYALGIGLDIKAAEKLPSPKLVMLAMHTFMSHGQSELNTKELMFVLPRVHRDRLHYVIYNLIQASLIEKTGLATYKLTEAGKNFEIAMPVEKAAASPDEAGGLEPASVQGVKLNSLEDALNAVPEILFSEFDKKVLMNFDEGSKIAMYVLYVNDLQKEGNIISRAQIDKFVSEDKRGSAHETIYHMVKVNGWLERADGADGKYKLTEKGRKALGALFNERYVHRIAGQPMPLPVIAKEFLEKYGIANRLEYAAFLLGREGKKFSRFDLTEMLGTVSAGALVKVTAKFMREGILTYVEGSKMMYCGLTEKGIQLLAEKYAVPQNITSAAAAPVPSAPVVPQASRVQANPVSNVLSLFEGLSQPVSVLPLVSTPPAEPVVLIPVPTPAPVQEVEKPVGPTSEERRATMQKLDRFWKDHNIPVSEQLIGQIMNGSSIEPFLGEDIKKVMLGGKPVFVPSGVSNAAFGRWQILVGICSAHKGQPVAVEDAAMALHTDTDTFKKMAHGLRKSGIVEIALTESEGIKVHDPQTIENRVGMCLKFGMQAAITTADLMNMTGLSEGTLLMRGDAVASAIREIAAKQFPQDIGKISFAFDAGKGGKNPVIIVSRKDG